MKLHTALLILTVVCHTIEITSCTPDNPIPATGNEKTVTINGLSSTHWVYFSFNSGNIVGSSKYGSSSDDALWQIRLDWDIALCGDKIKTNSGTSGKGKGGMLIDPSKQFEEIIVAPTSGYSVDELH